MPYILALIAGAGIALLVGQLHSISVGGDNMDRPLDPDLPESIERAIVIATSLEKDPNILRGFAQSLVKMYPISAGVLNARARVLELQATSSGKLNLNPFHDVSEVAKTVTKPFLKAPVIRNVAHEVEKLNNSKPFKLVKTGFVALHPLVFGAMLVESSGKDALKGERLDHVLNDVRLKSGHWLQQEALLASFVPGVGTIVAPVLSAAGALALGQPIPDAIINVAASAVPGGPAAQTAVRSGATFAVDLTKGEKLGQAALNSARAALPDAAKPAFDVGLALAQGKNLQKAGFAAAAGFIESQSGSVAEQVLGAIDLSGAGDLVKQAKDTLKDAIPPGAADAAKTVASAIASRPKLAKLTAIELAKQLHVPEPVVRATLAATHEVAPGAPVIDPNELSDIVGLPSPPPQVVDAAHAALALAAAKGNASAKKQLSYIKTQQPAIAPAIAAANDMAHQALWAASYLAKEQENNS